MTERDRTTVKSALTAAPGALPLAPQRANWVRLHTLILVRWIAVGGQIAALVIAELVLGIDTRMGLCSLLIAVSAALNLWLGFFYPASTRLTARQSTLMLLFDICQLLGLVALTGGLENPFAVLVLAPVTISATALPLRHMLIVAGVAVALTTLVALLHLPLRMQDGTIIAVPPILTFGYWTAIVTGTLFLSAYARSVSTGIHAMSEALLVTQMALAREQKLTDLAGVVAAAAHELGTPLATIKLASAEMVHELKDRPDLAEDAALIRDQADRCRDILRSMGRAGKRDSYIAHAPLAELLREAAEPHMGRGKTVEFLVGETAGMVSRRPEVIHALRNLIQNAVDFAKSTVWVECDTSGGALHIRVLDDGPGFPPGLFTRLGDPFLPRRERSESPPRPEYEGMGLGLFIAKTLLERTGAELEFLNHARPGRGGHGAMVRVSWPADAGMLTGPDALPLPAENAPITD